jgi:phosphoribosylformylglycinamidine (FGAM) synthase-like enzyme
MPWEKRQSPVSKPTCHSFEIMIDGPIGGASFGNDLEGPSFAGYLKLTRNIITDVIGAIKSR